MTLSIRAARDGDIDELVRLNRVVQRLHALLHPELFKAVTDDIAVAAYFFDRLEISGNYVRLAEMDEKAVGYIWFERQRLAETPFTRPGERFYLHHIAVDEAAQRHGIASALFQNMEDEARASGIAEIALFAWTTNLSGQAFFASRGLKPVMGLLGKTLA